jgi:SusD family.
MFTSCEKFLDSTNYWSKTTDDFPKNESDADQLIVSIYNILNVSIGNNVHLNHFLWSLAASDDCLGGGGPNDPAMQAEDLMLKVGADMYNDYYCERYKGVNRANLAIQTLEQCGLSDTKYNQYMGEAYFMRAYYMYELGSMFGNIPYPTSTAVDATQPQVSGEELWGQILEDLKWAVDHMPAVKAKGDGHVDKYCAEALLGRVYLFASGFLGIDTFNTPNGETVDKAYVGSAIADCVNNSGYSLVSDFHNLWAYTNRCSVEDELSPWKGQGYKWVENDGAVNPEAMFMIKFNCQPSWSTTIGYCNQTSLFVGVRTNDSTPIYADGQTFPFGNGWGMCPVNPQFVADWEAIEPKDARRDASVISVSKWPSYDQTNDNMIQSSGYYMTKLLPVIARDTKGGAGNTFWASFSNEMYDLTWSSGNEDNFQLNSIHDFVLIRFAEVLLMDAELNGSQTSFDKVRARAGLASKTASTENIRNERRWELAFEGVRFNDLRRYGADVCAAALDKQEGVSVLHDGKPGTNNASKYNGGYGSRYKTTLGFAPLPAAQISLSAGAGEEYRFTQNAGWEGAGSDYAGW